MFKTLLVSFIFFFTVTTSAQVVRLSQPVTSDDKTETFGTVLDSSLEQVNLATLLSNPDKYVETPFALRTEIAKVCQKKGCFFIAKEAHLSIRVAFKDYGFFVPSDSYNKVVTLNGLLVKKQLSQKQADHFNQDLKSENALLKAGKTFEIVAAAVQIPKA